MTTAKPDPQILLNPDTPTDSVSARTWKLRFWQGLAILYLLLTTMAWAIWGSTADALIDFGRELYVPWQMAEGKILYQEIAYFNGPLSPWINSFLFQCFGTSILTLYVANACILAAIVTIIYAQLARRFSVVAATVACTIMLAMSGMGQVNYNYLTPYSHELTHGLFLSLIILCLIGESRGKLLALRWSCAGICYGLIFLGKPEIFVAATAMIGCSLVLRRMTRASTARELTTQTALLAAFAFFTIAIAFFHLRQQMTDQLAWQGMLGGWNHMFGSDVTKLLFYRRVSGLEDPAANLLRIFTACLATGSLLLALYLLEKDFAKRGWWNPLVMLLFLLSIHLGDYQVLALHQNAFSCIAAGLFVGSIYLVWKHPQKLDQYHLLACWSTLGCLLLCKTILRPRFGFYGFALTMPVLVLSVALAIDWLPKVLFAQKGGRHFRSALIGLLIAQASLSFASSVIKSQQKQVAISQGVDRLRCLDEQGVLLNQATHFLQQEMSADETLLVLPEGISMNYLLRHENPIPYINFMQPEMVMYGEANMLRQLQQHPSDYIVLLSRPFLREYGLEYFGQPGYGNQIMGWIGENYVMEKQLGAHPSNSEVFGLQIFKLRAEQKLPVKPFLRLSLENQHALRKTQE